MAQAPVAAKRNAPVPKGGTSQPTAEPVAPRTFTRSKGIKTIGQRVILYGTGGIGKSCLAALAPKALIIDLEGGTHAIDAERIEGVKTFADLRAALRDDALWKDSRTVVIDSGTAAQKLAVEHTIQTVAHEKGHMVTSVEGYGFGKGYQHVLEMFDLLLADLDRHIEAGRNVVMVSHETTENVPNPQGENYLQYQPQFQQPPKTGRLRDRIKQWCDHLLYIEYERSVKDGKAVVTSRRLIQPEEQGHFWAKSRTLRSPVQFVEGDDTLWQNLLPQEYPQ